MLYKVQTEDYSKSTRWCGPAALATLTGMPLVQATEVLTRIHGGSYTDLDGVWPEDVIIALNEQGKRATQIDMIKRYPTLTHGRMLENFLRDRTAYEKINPMLIQVDNHFVSAHMDYLCDNWVMSPTHWTKFPKLGRKVKNAWVITTKV